MAIHSRANLDRLYELTDISVRLCKLDALFAAAETLVTINSMYLDAAATSGDKAWEAGHHNANAHQAICELSADAFALRRFVVKGGERDRIRDLVYRMNAMVQIVRDSE